MKRVFSTLLSLAIVVFFAACGDSGKTDKEEPDTAPSEKNDTEINDSTSLAMEAGGITLTEVTGSPEYEGSSLKITSPESGAILEPGAQDFAFTVDGESYKLATPTLDADIKKCANSDKGQHLHLIVNNEPYEAVYGTSYGTKREFTPGNYVALAFLSRSYHMSVKSEGSAALVQFQVGEEALADEVDLEAPHLFYSRPKGSYDLSAAPNLLLDFYLVNAEIAPDGNFVEVTFDGDASKTFKITKWAPYWIGGLGSGDHTIKMQLKDKDGNFIEGPFNSVERTFAIK